MHTEKLLTLDYYIDKISLSMQNDPIFMQEINDCVEFLQCINNQINTFELAMSTLLFDIIINDEDIVIENYRYSDLLDKIASIFNLSRNFIIDFKNPLTNTIDQDMQTNKESFEAFNSAVANNTLDTTLSLTNNQLRALIYCTIMKNSYDGSYEMLDKTYKTVCKFMATEIAGADTWQIFQATKFILLQGQYIPNPAETDCILSYSSDYEFTNENKEKSQYFTLFFAGLLTIRSAGISYYYQIADLSSLLYWSPEPNEALIYPADSYKWSVEPESGIPADNRKWL